MDLRLFVEQMNRLRVRFGKSAFDDESTKLIHQNIYDLTPAEFVKVVDFMISSRAHNRPPLVSDFRDARLREEKARFQEDMMASIEKFEHPAAQDGLKKYLAKAFPGCKNLNEAIEVRRLQIQVAKANDPSYDPLKDPKWM